MIFVFKSLHIIQINDNNINYKMFTNRITPPLT